MNTEALFRQPEYVPGISSGAADPEELARMVQSDYSATPLVRALADSVEMLACDVAGAEARAEQAEAEVTNLETLCKEEEERVADLEDVCDEFRDLLYQALTLFAAMPAITPEIGELCDHIREARREHPSRAEIAAEELRKQREFYDAAERAVKELPGFAEMWPGSKGKPVCLQWKVPRGRKWHQSPVHLFLCAENVPHLLRQAASIGREHPGSAIQVVLA